MAVINPCGYLQNAGATHTAEQFRNWMGALTGGKVSTTSLISRGGVKHDSGSALQVTQSGSPAMSVIVKSGHAAISGTEGSKQGVYLVMNDADVTLSISAAHATLNRIDSVVFKVEDAAYSGAANTSSLVVVTGTPAGSPVAPTLPANSLELARVSVVALDTSITNGEITDRRTYLAATGGVITATSGLRPAANTVTSGQRIYETDTARSYITHDAGTTWSLLPNNYLARNTLSGTAASVTFSSIPTNLRTVTVRYRARSNSGAITNVNMTINGSAAASYTQYSAGSTDGADVTPAGGGGLTSAGVGLVPGTTTRFSANEIMFTSWDITTLLQWHYRMYAFDGNLYIRHGGGNFDVAGPYTSITLTPSAGSFVSGSDFQLEGIYA